MRTFHLPLSEELHDELHREAAADARPAAEIVREALASWLKERQRQRLAVDIERYAGSDAGVPYDLDEDLEAAGIEVLAPERDR